MWEGKTIYLLNMAMGEKFLSEKMSTFFIPGDQDGRVLTKWEAVKSN